MATAEVDNRNVSLTGDSKMEAEVERDTQPHNFINSWAHQSYGISNKLIATIESLADIPSFDRRSNNFLMGTSLQSMILGTSLLSVPYCVKVAGIWGLVLVAVIGAITSFTATILSDCQYQISKKLSMRKRVHTTFVDMCHACFNTWGRYLMEALVYMSLARNVVVIILLSDLSHEVLNDLHVLHYDKHILSVAWTAATLPLLFVKKISQLAWVNFIGMLLYLSSIMAMIGLFFTYYQTWQISDISYKFDLRGCGISIGIIINSYAVHMNMPSLEGSMRTPSAYSRTTIICFLFNITAKLVFGIFGFLTYTSNTKEEISSNLDQFLPFSTILKCCLLFFAYFTIPLQSHVVFELIDARFMKNFPLFTRRFWWVLITRLICMTACLFVAVCVPHFGLALSVIGSVRGSLIALVLPSLFYLQLKTHQTLRVKRIFCMVVVCLGVVLGSTGLFFSIDALAKSQ